MTKKQLEAKIQTIHNTEGCRIDITKLNEDQVFALTAYELWKDGMDWDTGIPQIAEGKEPLYNTREKCMHILKAVFGY
jgi:hypothetical protein